MNAGYRKAIFSQAVRNGIKHISGKPIQHFLAFRGKFIFVRHQTVRGRLI